MAQSAFTGIWIQTHEPRDALKELAGLCRGAGWMLAAWDMDQGFSGELTGTASPLAAVRGARSLAERLGAAPAGPDGKRADTAVLVLRNFHRFLGGADIVQALDSVLDEGKQTRVIVVVMSPVVALPVELEKQFVTIEHPLPDRAEAEAIVRGVVGEDGMPGAEEAVAVVDAAGGLTRLQIERSAALSLVRHGAARPEAMWTFKAAALKQEGLMELYRGGGAFADLGGLDALKEFCATILRPNAAPPGGARARGVMLLGPPGSGKSAFAKALGAEVGRPTVLLDVGALMGSLVGQTEERTRRALRTFDAMAPCVVMVDEVEKAFSGIGGAGDNGVATRMFGSFLSYLNDHETDVFFVVSANDVSRLPPEFARPERFDGTFFLDLPGVEQRAAIWKMYQRKYGLEESGAPPLDSDWTGAEIKACCRLAALQGKPLVQAARNVVPVAVTAREKIDALRSWAGGRCLSAETGGIYGRDVVVAPAKGEGAPDRRLRVGRGPTYEAS